MVAHHVCSADDGSKHVFRVALADGKLMKVMGTLPCSADTMTFLDAKVDSVVPFTVQVSEMTQVFAIHPACYSNATSLVELCSGIGCSTMEAARVGFSLRAAVDQNARWKQIFDECHPEFSTSVYIAGEASCTAVRSELFARDCQHGVFVAGINCQPFSSLGDKRGLQDSRSDSLTQVLDTAWMCQANTLVLECVPQIASNQAAQTILREFCQRTGYHMTQHEQHLHTTWCARRSRWFAILTAPVLGKCVVPPIPPQPQYAKVQDVMPYVREWDPAEIEQVQLSLYEMAKFDMYAPGGIRGSFLQKQKTLPTCLHSAGNQLYPCQCGCRAALSHERLSKDGLHAALVDLGTTQMHMGVEMSHARYLHPREMFLLNGGNPKKTFGNNARLALAAIGQCISPLVGLWVLAHVKQHLDAFLSMDEPCCPDEVYKTFVRDIHVSTEVLWPRDPTSAPCTDQGTRNDPLHEVPSDKPADHAAISPANSPVHSSCTDKGFPDMLAEHDAIPNADSRVHSVCTAKGFSDMPTSHDTMPHADSHVHSPCTAKGFPDMPTGPAAIPSADSCVHSPCMDPVQCHDDGYALLDAADVQSAVADPASPMQPTFAGESGPLPFRLPSFSVAGECGLLPFRLPFFSHDGESGPLPYRLPSDEPGDTMQPTQLDTRSDEETAPPPVVQAAPAAPVEVDQAKTVELSIPATCGGIPSFRKRPHTEVASPQVSESDEGLTQAIAQDIEAIEAAVNTPPPKIHRTVRLHHRDTLDPQFVTMDATDTVGSLTVAEDRLKTMKQPVQILNAVGVPIPLASLPEPFQMIMLREMSSYGTTDPRFEGMHPLFQTQDPCKRGQLLAHQGSWVAMDEFTHYLLALQDTHKIASHPPCHIDHLCMDEYLTDKLTAWFRACDELCQTNSQVATGLLIHQHWIPVLIRPAVNVLHVLTTQDGHDWIDAATQHLRKLPKVTVCALPSVFHNDCGFQSIAWLISHIEYREQVEPFTVASAITWRSLFEHHLQVTGFATVLVRPDLLPCGAANSPELARQLQQLLESHGVTPSQSAARADAAIERIGRAPLTNAMRATNQWKELKALANQCSPKLQLVLPSELQAAIDKRLQDPAPFGNRRKKMQRVDKAPVALQPEDVIIPDGIFKEGESTPLSQIGLQQIGAQARGIVIATSTQVGPYLRATKPVSNAGLALLVLDHAVVGMHGVGEVVRIPAQCSHTSEPMLLTAKLVQIGSVIVSRVINTQVPKVEEVDNMVVKALIYRDELHDDWDFFVKHPVRWLQKQFPELVASRDEAPKLLDCWDRQTLNAKMERARGDTVGIYAVSLRLAYIDLDTLLQKSGHGPTYFEPRQNDGKGHDEQYRVIWLGKSDKATAMMEVQSLEVWGSLARSGDRYGVRVHKQHAAATHKQLKPQVPYLDSNQLSTWIAGPFPFGATRQSLSKLFALWQWPARPTQPKGRSADSSGILWEIQASEAPQYGVYQLEHSDILITEQPKKSRTSEQPKPDVQASAKTIAALRKPVVPAHDTKLTDPWHVGVPDPWAHYEPPSKAMRFPRDGPPSASTDAIAKQVEQRVMAKLESFKSKMDDDAQMSAMEDTRISDLEAKVLHIEHQVQKNQITQEQNHLEVTGHVAQLQTQVESQSSQIQRHMDQRMQEQLDHIERLLRKRSGE